MKKYYQRPIRHALAVLTAGLVLGGLVAADAQNSTVFPTNVYYMSKNVPANTPAPYSAGGGVPAGALLTVSNITSTSCTFSWYGMRGWSTVQGTTNFGTNWVNLNSYVAATNYAWTATTTNPFGTSASFRLNQNNSYVGQSACAGCHADKYAGWTNTPHSYAITALLNPDGSFTSSHANPSCLLCHTVGDGQPTGYVYTSNSASYSSLLAYMGCEDCHGPAGWHRASEKDMITPAVSLDPAICGSCHQGHHPQYTEYTNVNYTAISNAPMGILLAAASHANKAGSGSFGCSPCHAANNRMAMVKEYYDRLAGNPHPVTLFTTTDAGAFGGATCVTCHDPHGSNYVAQLRYPTSSTNWYCVPTVTDPTPVLVTNVNGSVTTNSTSFVANNTIFDSFFNPNIQVCGQCHSSRGARWDGTAYGLITNSAVSTNITLAGYYVGVTTYVTNVQVYAVTNYNNYIFTNGAYVQVPIVTITTNSSVIPYATNQVWMASVTSYVTNSTLSMGVYYPLIAYTNGGTVYNSTNSKGDSAPHYPMQYNVLIGMLDYDYPSNGVPVVTHPHTRATNQCVDCHVPSYVSGGANHTGHSFVADFGGCLASCHSSYSPAGLAAKVLNEKTGQSNSMARVVSLLNQWGTNVAPGILRTNYGPLAWEYPSIGALSLKTTNNGVVYSSGPPSAYSASKESYPSGTNDNLQLNYVPSDIRLVRFSLYSIYEDQSLGVHNPSYVSALLADAEKRVMKQFTASNYAASFAATTVSGFAPLTVAFTNYGTASIYNWNFGDGQDYSGYTAANPTYTYNTPGLYSVTCTADGKPLTRTKYIWVQAPPVPSFTADSTTITNGQKVTFTNTSSNVGDVYRYRWYPMNNVNSSVRFDLGPGEVFSYTYTNAAPASLSVKLTAYAPAGSVSVTNNAFITVTAP